jgi:hypothetical protein
MLARNARKVGQKIVQGIAFFKVVDKAIIR